jgi:hypothetical protein
MSRLVTNRAEYQAFFYSPSGPVMTAFRDEGNLVRNEAARNTPVDTGQHRASLEVTQARVGNYIVTRVGSPLDTFIYLEKGTGLFGPKGQVIRPVSKKVLRFKAGRFIGPLPRGQRGRSPEKRGGWIFAKYVKGSPRHDMLVNALKDMTPYPVTVTPD